MAQCMTGPTQPASESLPRVALLVPNVAHIERVIKAIGSGKKNCNHFFDLLDLVKLAPSRWF